MLGASRWSLAAASDALVERSRTDGAALAEVGPELFAVAGLLETSTDLRRLLSDSGVSDDRRRDVATRLLGNRVRPDTLEIVVDVVGRRWSTSGDLVDAVEQLGAQASFLAAEEAGRIDAVEDELYRLARIVEGNAELRTTLTDRWLPADRKVAVVRELFADRVDATTLAVAEQVVGHPRGRRVEDALEGFARLAAERHAELLAEAHVARPLTPEQVTRLSAALTRVYGRQVRVTVVTDPAVVGGVRVVVGEEVVDGSVARRIEQARSQLAG
jgi:F-type H+-transporting ATPase subunit delta